MFMRMIANVVGGGAGGVVTLSGETIEDADVGTTMLFIGTDGTVDKADDLPRAQIDSATDWIIPNGAASGLYEVKWDFLSGDVMNVGNMIADEGTWLALSTERSIGLSVGVPILDDGSITVSIRYNGGPTLSSATYRFRAIDTS